MEQEDLTITISVKTTLKRLFEQSKKSKARMEFLFYSLIKANSHFTDSARISNSFSKDGNIFCNALTDNDWTLYTSEQLHTSYRSYILSPSVLRGEILRFEKYINAQTNAEELLNSEFILISAKRKKYQVEEIQELKVNYAEAINFLGIDDQSLVIIPSTGDF